MEIIRTPDERFQDLPGYDFAPHYVDVDGLRMHYVEEGPPAANPVLMLHGEPSWCFLYRKNKVLEDLDYSCMLTPARRIKIQGQHLKARSEGI